MSNTPFSFIDSTAELGIEEQHRLRLNLTVIARMYAAGTTIAGVHELEKVGVRNAFINAVMAAANRADELSKQ